MIIDARGLPAGHTIEADLCVMAYVTLIVPEDVLNLPTRGTIQYHPSLLPRHRGPSSINWPIIQGETRTGLSIFWPDQGLDTGPIMLQKDVEILDTDTLGSLYSAQFAETYEAAHPMWEEVGRGQFSGLLSWLRANVHQIGQRLPTEEIVARATGKGLDTAAFFRHLEARLGALA